jgi:hypothetical protein
LKTQKRICKKSDCDGRSFFVFGGVEIALIVLTAVNVYPLFNGCTVEAVCAEFYTGDILIKNVVVMCNFGRDFYNLFYQLIFYQMFAPMMLR